MKRLLVLLFVTAASAVGAFAGYSFWQQCAPEPDIRITGELEWLRMEFDLDAEQFGEVERLHAEYWPVCENLCAKVIDAQNRFQEELLKSNEYSASVEAELANLMRVKEDCHRAMLRHIYEVAAIMEPEARARYLAGAGAQVMGSGRPHGILATDPESLVSSR